MVVAHCELRVIPNSDSELQLILCWATCSPPWPPVYKVDLFWCQTNWNETFPLSSDFFQQRWDGFSHQLMIQQVVVVVHIWCQVFSCHNKSFHTTHFMVGKTLLVTICVQKHRLWSMLRLASDIRATSAQRGGAYHLCYGQNGEVWYDDSGPNQSRRFQLSGQPERTPCWSVFVRAAEQSLSLHQQLSISLLKFSLSLHLPLHILPQSLKHTAQQQGKKPLIKPVAFVKLKS